MPETWFKVTLVVTLLKKGVEAAFKKELEGWQDIPSSERHQCWVLERQLPSWIWQKGHRLKPFKDHVTKRQKT